MKEDNIIFLGNLLIDNINSNTDLKKIKLLNEITKYKNNKDIEKDKEMKQIDSYMNTYNKPRISNNKKYETYFKEREILYNKWYISKNIKDLYELLALKSPEYVEIPEIYTYHKTYQKCSSVS